MGGYAEAIRRSFPGAVAEPHLPPDTGWVVLTTSDPGPDELRRAFPSPRELLVVGVARPREARRGVSYAQIRLGPPPSLSPQARALLEGGGFGAAVLLDGVAASSGRLLLELHRLGVTRVAWREGVDWVEDGTRRLALRKPFRRVEAGLARTRLGTWYRRRLQRARAHDSLKQRNAQAFHGEEHWLRHLQRVAPRPADASRGRLEVLLYIGQLNSGGAERQLCNLALGLRRRGHGVRVLTTYPLADENAHYCEDLARAGVAASVAGAEVDREGLARLLDLDVHPEVVGSLPEVIRNPVLDLAGELLARPPHVLHCWLDYPNIIGAAAGALVGQPHVVLSTRNVNPTHFPAFYQGWMDAWYAFLTTLPHVHLSANSHPGARDYARWLGLAPSRFEVIHNGVDLAGSPEPSPEAVARVRRELALAPGQPLVLGVFRLAAEKQPDLFLDVVERVRRKVPDLAVALVGVGELRATIEKAIERRRLGRCVRLLGQRKDVSTLLRAADVKLLTSAVEGTPNVILEAQWAGCPPVATAGGGTPDALEDGVSGFLHGCDDAPALADSVIRLLGDRALREAMGRAGRQLVARRFGLDRMVDETVEHYLRMLDPEAAPPREVRPLRERVVVR